MAFADDSFLPGDEEDGTYPKKPKQPFSLEDQLYQMGGVGGEEPYPEPSTDSGFGASSGGGFPETTPTGPIDDPWGGSVDGEGHPTTPPNEPHVPDPSTPAPPTAPGAPTAGVTPAKNADEASSYFNSVFPGDYLDSAMLIAKEQDLLAHGIKVLRNAEGRAGKIQIMATGEIIDVVQGGGSGVNKKQWLTGGGGAAGAGGAGGAYPGANGAVGEAIARLLARGEAPVSMKDPSLAGASAAHRAAMTRGVRNSRAALAERAAANGLNSGGAGSGAFDTGIQSQEEGAALNNANFDSGLVLDEIKQRRSDVVNALQFAQGEERMALQHALAMLNDQLARAQMSQQNKQWYDAFTYGMSRDAKNDDNAAAGGLY